MDWSLSSLPTRGLPERPDLDHLKRQAKDLLKAFAAGDSAAAAEVHAHYRGAASGSFALHDAQLVIARAYGFDSWPKLKAFVEGATQKRLAAAVRAGDVELAREMLLARPELARSGAPVLLAVLDRRPEMVRLLMEHGANPREGVYPHREATNAWTIACERGYEEIVAIFEAAERLRREARGGEAVVTAEEELFQAIGRGGAGRVVALVTANPSLAHARSRRGWTPLEAAAHVTDADSAVEFRSIADALLRAGAGMSPRAAVALGDADWLHARHAEGTLQNEIADSGGLLRVAASHNRADILALLLEMGFDPDERTRIGDGDEVEFTWGMPLWHCAGAGKHEMARMLLDRGADPNARVYASGDPVFQAYSQQDWEMVKLLESYGGVPQATSAGLYRQTDLARKMLAGEAKYGMDGVGGDTLAEQLLWGSACGGDAEIVGMALEQVDWPRDDRRWFHMLEQPLRIWARGSVSEGWDRSTYLTCFRLILERADPNLVGRVEDEVKFGLTLLHTVAGARDHVTPDECIAFATMLLDAGARLDARDGLLKSTPLGWACRWGRIELVRLFLERGADPIEAAAEPWAQPRAWAEKMGHEEIAAILENWAGAS